MRTDDVMQAAKEGNRDALRRLLAEDPAIVNARLASGETPLMAALYRGHADFVEALVDAGAALDVFAAAALGRTDVLEPLIAGDPSLVRAHAYDGWTPLHLAAFFGQRNAVERLIAAGADMNAISTNALRNSPLHAAIAGRHADLALLLIGAGADVTIADSGGHTPFHIAAEEGFVPVVKALLARGADAHAVDAEDRTPLARAAARGHTEVVDLINVRE
jgi:ankyrin repeat protein